LYFGVTSVVDAGGALLPSVHLRDRIARGEVLGPSMKVLGPFLTVPQSHPCEVWNDPDACWFAEDAAAAGLMVDALTAAGTDGMKAALADAAFTSRPRLDPSVLAAAAARVSAAGGLVFAHVDTEADALDAVTAGATHLAHPPFGDVSSSGAAAAIAASGAPVHTTVSAFAAVDLLLSGDMPLDDLLLAPGVAANWAAVVASPGLVDAEWRADTAAWAANARASLAALDAAGVPLMPASDAGYWYVPFGWGLHHELAELRALGWDPQRALTAATVGNARAVGWTDRGLVAPGQRADLLVLAADPLVDLAALQAPDPVVVAGRAYAREDLRAAEVVVVPASGVGGDPCVSGADCPGGACDAVERVCASTCSEAWDPVGDDCDAASACQPSDDAGASPALCRVVDQPCDPYDASSCAPEVYADACVPGDLDTFYCFPSGPKVDGEACSYDDPDQMCGPGLFCSFLVARCYTLCDPSLGPTQPVCTGGTRCLTQYAEPGAPWFGLCL
jgi:imidazolonepropionase-like amidohydrolase